MRMAFHHEQRAGHRHHPLRNLIFALVVIIIAMMVSALTFLRTNPAPISQEAGDSVFMTVALEMTDGEEVFNRVCTTCHAIERPTDMETEPIAPPMKMIAQRYTMATESVEDARTRIVTWLEKPDAEQSLLPAIAIEHHGLMPPVVLTDDERTAVADYVLSLLEAEHGNMMQRMHQMQGDGEGKMMGKMHQMKDGEGMKGCNHQKKGEGEMKCPMHEESGEGEEGGMKGCKHKMNGQKEGGGHQHGTSNNS